MTPPRNHPYPRLMEETTTPQPTAPTTLVLLARAHRMRSDLATPRRLERDGFNLSATAYDSYLEAWLAD